MEHLGVVKRRKGVKNQSADQQLPENLSGTLLGDEATVQWGGTGLSTPAGSDLQEQEALLARMFKPHKVRNGL